jgi:hypothetical protein
MDKKNSKLEIFTMEQNTEAWFEARLGIITASHFGEVMSKGRGKKPSKTCRSYMVKLAAEILTKTRRSGYVGYDMLRGIKQEPDARAEYEFQTGQDVNQIGFAKRDDIGCSPDGLVYKSGGIEIKSVIPEVQIETVIANIVPEIHKPQIQGVIYVMDLDWLDFVSYSPLLNNNFLFIKRSYRDNEFIDNLKKKLETFNKQLLDMVKTMS